MTAMPHPRSTSVDTYHALVNRGGLTPLRRAIYDILYRHGPLTCKEVTALMMGGTERDSVSPRMKELSRSGVIKEAGERICSVSKRRALLWDVTGEMPVKPDPAAPRLVARGGMPCLPAAPQDVDELRAALAPFAKLFNDKTTSPMQTVFVLTDDLRRAAELLAKKD